MTRIIELHLRRLRRQIRLRAVLTGVFLTTATWLTATAAVSALDWYFEFSIGVRVLLLVAVLLGTAAVAWRYLVLPVVTTLSDVWLAQQIERYYPELRDRLASAVSFLKEDAPETIAGSRELREAVIREASRAALAIEPEVILRRRPFRWATVAFLATGLLAGVLLWRAPQLVRIGLARLYAPFGSARWPHQTVLEFVELRDRLARGEPYRVRVRVVSGRVPDRAVAHFAFREGGRTSEPMRPQGRREFVAALESILSPFELTIEAGGASLGPVQVQVLPPPDVARLQITVTYPEYTAKGTETLPAGTGHVRAVWGSQLQVAANFTKPVARAELVFDDRSTIPLQLGSDRRSGSATFRLERDGTYWLRLVDTDGLMNRRFTRYELRALRDKAPEVFVDKPQGAVYVTPRARLPVQVTVKDDYGVRHVWLAYWKGEEEPEKPATIDLFGPQKPQERVEASYLWELEQLKLTVGEVVSFQILAADADNLRGPNVAKSRLLRAYVVTGEELLERLADRQRAIQEELERVLRQQERAVADVQDLLEEAQQDAAVKEETVGQMRATELSQQQVRRRLTGSSGLRRLAQETLEALENNRLEQDELAQRLRELIAAADTLDRSALAEAERQLLVARKAAETAARRQRTLPQRGEQALARARQAQQQVVHELQRMLEEFGRYENLRAVARDAQRLADQQEKLIEQARELGARTVGKSPEQLSPELRAELGKLSNRQEQLRGGLRQLRARMRQLSERLAQQDPLAAETLRQAAENIERAGTEDLMRDAARQLRANRIGQATQQQRQAAEDLKALLDALQQNATPDLKELVEQLRELERKLEDVRRRQLQLLQRTRQVADQADDEQRRRELQRLARQQRQLEQQLSRLAQQMARLNARRAARRSSSAAGRMGQAGQSMAQNNPGAAQQQQERVLEELQQAQQELQRARREAEALLAMEQLRQIESQLASLYERQKAAAEETVRIRQTRKQRYGGRWTRPLLATLGRLREEQSRIRADTEEAIGALDSAPAFALVLKHATGLMERALQRLKQRSVDEPTARLQQQAAAQIAKLLEALKQDAEGNQRQQGSGGSGGGGSGGGSGISLIAQLKLLKMLQIDIKAATEQIEQLRQQGKLSDADRQRLKELEQLQGELADIVRQLTAPAADDEPQNGEKR